MNLSIRSLSCKNLPFEGKNVCCRNDRKRLRRNIFFSISDNEDIKGT